MMCRGHQFYSYPLPWHYYLTFVFENWNTDRYIYFCSDSFLLFKLMLDSKDSLFRYRVLLGNKMQIPAQRHSFSGTGNGLENVNKPKSPRTLNKALMISFLSLPHASLLWVMLWKHIGHYCGKNVKMINNMILLENDQIMSKVNGMVHAEIFTQTYF